jgi:hypothetical protein
MDADACAPGPAPVPTNDNVAGSLRNRQQPPKGRRAAVAHRRAPTGENGTTGAVRALPKCQHRREQSSLRGQRDVPHGIHAAMHAMKACGSKAPADRLFVEPKATQLVERDHPVLPRRDFSDMRVGLGDFPPH